MANFSTILSSGLAIHLRGYLSGLVLSTAGSSATFSVAAGVAVDDVQRDFMTLASSISKTTSAWAVGTGNGGIDTGAVAINTWYHVYLIKRPDTGVVDVLFSLSVSAPTMPTNYTLKRRIGSLKTNASSQWTAFTQEGDEFLWLSPVQDAASTTQSTTAVLYTLSVPTGVKVTAISMYEGDRISAGGLFSIYVSSPDQNDDAVGNPGSAGFGTLGMFATAVSEGIAFEEIRKRTNTSAQVRVRANAAINNLWIYTIGWIDTRGKL